MKGSLPALRVTIFTGVLLGSLGCSEAPPDVGTPPQGTVDAEAEALRTRADELAQEFLILDGHVDIPYRLNQQMEDISVRTATGDFDYPRARAGGLNAPFMSIYTPSSLQETGGSKELADTLIDMVEGIAQEHPDKFALATSVAEVRDQFARGLISLLLGMENGAPIGTDLNNLEYFYDRGVRYITLTHGKNNEICDSSYDEVDTWPGLSPFGEEVVAEMNRLGIMIDVSHVSDETFYQVMEHSKAPVIASHSSCRAFTPDFERNMSDEMIALLGERDGVIQINFGSSFITADINAKSKQRMEEMEAVMAAQGIDEDSEEGHAFSRQYRLDHPTGYADISNVLDHIDHVVEIAGIDHVGFGSDFDGVGDSLPTGLKDVSAYPNLIHGLLERGYTEEDIERICSGNALRVWSEVERIAEAARAASDS
jgi:membrane dipeptidase